MPGPQFVSCSICHRQIMPHSLTVHESKCMEKWCMENKTGNMSISNQELGQSENRPKTKQTSKIMPKKNRFAATAVIRPPLVVTSQFQIIGNKPSGTSGSISHGSVILKPTLESAVINVKKATNADGPSPIAIRPNRKGSIEEKRPGTVTLSPGGRATSLDRAGNGTNIDTASAAVCYICGQRSSLATLEIHEKKCLHTWECLVAKFPPTIRAYRPHKLRHPSVDGTVDPSRLDILASESSQRSQKVDCSKCRKTGIDLLAAREHVRQCGTKKPERPPKSDNLDGRGSIAKRKKAKDREIYVSIFA